MARQRKPKESPAGAPLFMLTWGDMCTLLMCFFVLIVAMSNVDQSKFKIAANSLQNALGGVFESLPTILIHQEIYMPKLGGHEQNKKLAMEAKRKIERVVQQESIQDAIKVKITDTGMAIKISDPVGFDVGKAQIRPEFTQLLYKVADIIKNMPGAEIRVEGHTDNTPISTVEFPSNWELSAARAASVVKFLTERCAMDPTKMSAVGYGEFRPVAPNTTAENKQKNRRIEIYVEYLQKKEQ